MKLEDQVVSLELAQKLKEIGVKQESYFWWYPEHKVLLSEGTHSHVPTMLVDKNYRNGTSPNKNFIGAFTVAELGEMMKQTDTMSFYGRRGGEYLWVCEHGGGYVVLEDTEADARAKMLIYLIENNLLNPKDI